jgi:hypothetical protein
MGQVTIASSIVGGSDSRLVVGLGTPLIMAEWPLQ